MFLASSKALFLENYKTAYLERGGQNDSRGDKMVMDLRTIVF